MGRKLLRCPDCSRRGVYLKLDTDDVYLCRYEYLGCEFFAYERGSMSQDLEGRRRLAEANPNAVL